VLPQTPSCNEGPTSKRREGKGGKGEGPTYKGGRKGERPTSNGDGREEEKGSTEREGKGTPQSQGE